LETSKLHFIFVTNTVFRQNILTIFDCFLYFIKYSQFFLFLQTMTLYVGNLNFNLTNDELKNIFSVFGEVTKAAIIIDKETNRSKGFAFVEFVSKEDGEKAISSMNGAMVGGRSLKVNEARPR